MPAIVLFGRRWHASDDDLPGPAALSVVFHAAWAGLLAASVAHTRSTCSNAKRWDAYLYCSLGLIVLNLCQSAWLMLLSIRGKLVA